MRSFTLSDLVDSFISFNMNFQIFKLISIDRFKFENDFLVWNLHSLGWDYLSSEVAWVCKNELLQGQLSQNWVSSELIQLWHGFNRELCVLRKRAGLEWSFVKLVLVFKSVHSNSLLNFFHEVSNNFANCFMVISNTHDVLAISHQHIKLLVVVGIVVWHSTHLCKLTNRLKELIGGACHLWLEVSEPENLSIFRV